MPALLRDSRVIDLLLALAALSVGTVDILTQEDLRGSLALNLLAVAAIGAAFYLRRRNPPLVAAGFVALACSMAAWLEPPDELIVPFFGLVLLPFAVGAYSDGRPAVAGWVALLLLPPLVEIVRGSPEFGDFTFLPLLVTAGWMAGRAVRSRTELAAELHEASLRAEEALEAESQRAVADERRRIAREMHDIVAHSVSVMVVQAGGARRILAKDPERAVEAAREIETAGRAALGEMRRMLGVLQGSGAADRAPAPGMSGIGDLIERARAAGQPVHLHEEGERRSLPAGMDLAAYRVVQEALTNAIKYASGAETDVTVRWSPTDVQLSVADAGGGWSAEINGGGHGLIGMQERVRLYGGELHSGPREGGGFEVRATIPLENTA